MALSLFQQIGRKMKTKETIAILGLKKGEATPFLDQLANTHRLLIVLTDLNDGGEVSEYLSQNAKHEVELINCAKDGCWEADLIILWNPSQFQEYELLRLQAVATQKIILLVTAKEQEDIEPSLFPNSKIVKLVLNSETLEGNLYGTDVNAVSSINELINKIEYLTL